MMGLPGEIALPVLFLRQVLKLDPKYLYDLLLKLKL